MSPVIDHFIYIFFLEETCYMKWKKLRDRFSREYRQIQLNPEKPITWIYFNDLRFLESHYRKG